MDAPGARSASRALVTGIGVVAPTGIGVEAWWSRTLAGSSAISAITRFDAADYPAKLAGQVPDFEPSDKVPARLVPQTDHMTRLALIAAAEAIEDAGIDTAELPPFSMGVMTAASGGGVEFGQRELQNMWSHGRQHVSAYQSFAWFYAVNTGQISIRHGMQGPSGVVVTENAGGIDAIGQARRTLRRGAHLMITGGTDGALCPWGWLAQLATRSTTPESDPARAYRPFAADATGYVPAEGGALFVAESEPEALGRGVVAPYGVLAGYAATFDARTSTDGNGLLRAATSALADAGLSASDVDLVYADAVGLPSLDRQEARVLRELFGPHGVPVTAPKTMTGRALAGGAALDVAAALLSIRDGVAPPTIGVEVDPALQLDLVQDRPRELPIRTVLVLARGYGGFNAAIVLTSY
jgi:act minimal PKS chain-length factor (CLF/KS beta)